MNTTLKTLVNSYSFLYDLFLESNLSEAAGEDCQASIFYSYLADAKRLLLNEKDPNRLAATYTRITNIETVRKRLYIILCAGLDKDEQKEKLKEDMFKDLKEYRKRYG